VPLPILEDGFMGTERQIKNMRRSVRKEQNKVVMRFIQNNALAVIGASVSMIQTMRFRSRLIYALKIIFSNKRRKEKAAARKAAKG
jgi:hypothetical protein